MPTEDLPSILQKEALYCAIGRCASKLKDVIPWDDWLAQSLLPEAQSTDTRRVLNNPVSRSAC